jgi:hypothetical protein
MNQLEFQALRDLRGKRITGDILFLRTIGSGPNLVFDNVRIENTENFEVVLNGTLKPNIPSLTFNFVLRGVGPICRLDVNGTIHDPVGRTHKHKLINESDPRKNLPTAFKRSDIDSTNFDVKKVWSQLCAQANIQHDGELKWE